MEGELLFPRIWRNHPIQSVQIIIAACLPPDNLNECVIFSPCGKGNTPWTQILGRLSNRNPRSYNSSPSIRDGKMATTAESPLNFLWCLRFYLFADHYLIWIWFYRGSVWLGRCRIWLISSWLVYKIATHLWRGLRTYCLQLRHCLDDIHIRCFYQYHGIQCHILW